MANWYKDYILKQTKYVNTLRIAKDLDWLYPPFRERVECLLKLLADSGLRMMVFETYRSQARQKSLYSKGATKIKENGMHHYGMACDIVFATKKGNPTWNGDWAKFGSIVHRIPGIYWGGDWKSFQDCPHVQGCAATVDAQNEIRKGNYPA
jgi:hypothetical protein